MTRRQAILQAIRILSSHSENDEIILKLQEILDELPLVTWTSKSIIDSIEDYAIRHNNILPNSKELTTYNKLPSNTVIYKIFGLTSINEFYQIYFSKYIHNKTPLSPYANRNKNYFLNTFKENYNEIKIKNNVKYVGQKMYDNNRKKGTPLVNTILRKFNNISYIDLLIICGYKKRKKEIEAEIDISYNDSIERNTELISILSQIDKGDNHEIYNIEN